MLLRARGCAARRQQLRSNTGSGRVSPVLPVRRGYPALGAAVTAALDAAALVALATLRASPPARRGAAAAAAQAAPLSSVAVAATLVAVASLSAATAWQPVDLVGDGQRGLL